MLKVKDVPCSQGDNYSALEQFTEEAVNVLLTASSPFSSWACVHRSDAPVHTSVIHTNISFFSSWKWNHTVEALTSPYPLSPGIRCD